MNNEEKREIICKVLEGLPIDYSIGIKNAYVSRAYPSTGSSPVLKEYIPSYSSEIYKKLSKIVSYKEGKYHYKNGLIIPEECDEFCRGSSGIFNSKKLFSPIDYSIIGGSSSGAAMNLLLNKTDVSICSDTGGSSRFPVLLSKGILCSFKPGREKIDKNGLIEYVGDLDTPSIMSKNFLNLRNFYHFLSDEKFEEVENVPNLVPKFDNREVDEFLLKHKCIMKEFYKLKSTLYCWSNIRRYDGRRFGVYDNTYPSDFKPCPEFLKKCEIERIYNLKKKEVVSMEVRYKIVRKKIKPILEQITGILRNRYYLRILKFPGIIFPENSNGMSDDRQYFLELENILDLPCILLPSKYPGYYNLFVGPKNSQGKLLSSLFYEKLAAKLPIWKTDEIPVKKILLFKETDVC